MQALLFFPVIIFINLTGREEGRGDGREGGIQAELPGN